MLRCSSRLSARSGSSDGEDLAQISWITASECDEFLRWLNLQRSMKLLEIGCGSGGVAVRIAEKYGTSVVGIDVNESAVSAAIERAEQRGVSDSVEFHTADANETLPFPANKFDVVFCNDSINHLKERNRVLSDWNRVLRSGGRCLYTDPIVVTGTLTSTEIAERSSIGFFLFTPLGINEKLIREAGFRLVLSADVTDNVAATSGGLYDARAKRQKSLTELEGESRFLDEQRFLKMVHTLASEQRLSRFAFVSEKVSEAA